MCPLEYCVKIFTCKVIVTFSKKWQFLLYFHDFVDSKWVDGMWCSFYGLHISSRDYLESVVSSWPMIFTEGNGFRNVHILRCLKCLVRGINASYEALSNSIIKVQKVWFTPVPMNLNLWTGVSQLFSSHNLPKFKKWKFQFFLEFLVFVFISVFFPWYFNQSVF